MMLFQCQRWHFGGDMLINQQEICSQIFQNFPQILVTTILKLASNGSFGKTIDWINCSMDQFMNWRTNLFTIADGHSFILGMDYVVYLGMIRVSSRKVVPKEVDIPVTYISLHAFVLIGFWCTSENMWWHSVKKLCMQHLFAYWLLKIMEF